MDGLLLSIGCDDREVSGFRRVSEDSAAGLRYDPRLGLPLPAGSVRGIYCAHFLEYLEPDRASAFLRECRRVLTPGGTLRLVTPDLDRVVRSYWGDWRKQDWMHKAPGEGIRRRGAMLNTFLRGNGRRWVHTEEELLEMAGWAGLPVARRRLAGRSGAPHFQNLETRSDTDLILELSPAKRAPSGEPLVSVLIPAYNPAFFEAALTSARQQTWRNLEIVVSDDSPGPEIRVITERAAQDDPRVRYLRNQPALGAYENYVRCYRLARGEYVKFLNDDDLLRTDCVERMAGLLAAREDVTLVTSHRGLIDASGEELPGTEATERIATVDSLLDGAAAAGLMLTQSRNFVGEPTTVMFRRADLEDAQPSPLSFSGRPVRWNVDVAMWAHLLGKGDLAYLVDTLSWFRQHGAQQTATPAAAARSGAAWLQMRADAARLGYPAPATLDEVRVRPLAHAHVPASGGSSLGLAIFARAIELQAAQRWSEAADLFQLTVAHEPHLAIAHLQLGLTRYSLGDYPAAAEEMERGISLDPDVPDSVKQLAADLRHRLEAREAVAR